MEACKRCRGEGLHQWSSPFRIGNPHIVSFFWSGSGLGHKERGGWDGKEGNGARITKERERKNWESDIDCFGLGLVSVTSIRVGNFGSMVYHLAESVALR